MPLDSFLTIYGLVVELLLCLGLFTFKLKRRKKFWLRLVAAVVFLALFSYIRKVVPLNYLTTKIVIYVVLYFSCFGFALFIFDESMLTTVYCMIGGTIAQHVCYTLSDCIRELASAYVGDIWGNVLYGAVFGIVALALFYLFSYKQDPKDYQKLQPGPVVVCSIILFSLCILILQVFEYYRADVTRPFYLLFVLMDTICCLSVYLIQSISYYSARSTIAAELSKNRLRQYESLQNVIELMNIRLHDLKHQIHRVEKDNNMDPEVMKDINEMISKYRKFARCGNDTLDTILTEKSITCEKEGIKLTYNINGRLINHFSVMDINSIFGNALDNAIDYLKTLPVDERFLTIRSFEIGNLAKISIENTFRGKATFNKQGLLDTTKSDHVYHGFGLKSIQSAVHKYQGNMTITVEDDMFKVQLLIPANNQEEHK